LDVFQPVTAEDRGTMQPVITRRIGPHHPLDMRDRFGLGGARLGVGFFHFPDQYALVEAHRNRVDFDELDAIGVVHSEGAR